MHHDRTFRVSGPGPGVQVQVQVDQQNFRLGNRIRGPGKRDPSQLETTGPVAIGVILRPGPQGSRTAVAKVPSVRKPQPQFVNTKTQLVNA